MLEETVPVNGQDSVQRAIRQIIDDIERERVAHVACNQWSGELTVDNGSTEKCMRCRSRKLSETVRTPEGSHPARAERC